MRFVGFALALALGVAVAIHSGNDGCHFHSCGALELMRLLFGR